MNSSAPADILIDPWKDGVEIRLGGLVKRINEIGNRTSEEKIRQLIRATFADENARLTKLRDDAIRALGLLVEAGVITQQRLNEVLS